MSRRSRVRAPPRLCMYICCIVHACSFAGIYKQCWKWSNIEDISKDEMVSYNRQVYIVWLVRELLFLWKDGCEYEPPLKSVYKNFVAFIDVHWRKAIKQENIVMEGCLYTSGEGCVFKTARNLLYKNLVALMDVHWARGRKTRLFIYNDGTWYTSQILLLWTIRARWWKQKSY